ncbi:PEGA domain-containing protein [Salinibacter ruber]|uniref:PEGA domain-containing protein n=1 Tax=Salinibacter ruber TaxID=146919 RepID=UPI002073121A|nr:PEGA domain-containing protein [Salinibacter ruber]
MGQGLQRHGEVTAVDGQEVTVRLSEGLSVSSGTAGTIYTTTTVGGEEQPLPVAQVEVTETEGRVVTVRVTNQSEKLEAGFLASFGAVRRVGTLVVEAAPTGATVIIDGDVVGSGTVRQQVEVGEHAVAVEAEGYQTARRGVQVGAGETRRISVSLQEAAGRLVIEAQPDSARIVIDGQMRGRGRAEATLSPGTYGVAVRAGGHVPVDTTAEVSAGEETTLSASLQRASGQLLVTTEPDSARVEIDGQRAGRAPVIRDLPAGEHEVRAVAEGYTSQRRSVTVAAGEREEVALTLGRNAGTLVIETDPGEARVRIGGETVGTAPVRRELSPGTYRVEAEEEGYETTGRPVEVTQGEQRRVRLSMQRSLRVEVADVHEGPVQGVRARREGETLVVTYSLGGEEDEYEVALQLSTDGGQTYQDLRGTVEGAVGGEVTPGSGKQVTWAALTDYPEGLSGDQYRLRVQAEAQGGRGLLYVLGSAAVVGGGAAVAVLTGLFGGGGDEGFPSPPAPPN